MINNKILELRKRLFKKQEVQEDLFKNLTSKEMMQLTQLLMNDYFSLSNTVIELDKMENKN